MGAHHTFGPHPAQYHSEKAFHRGAGSPGGFALHPLFMPALLPPVDESAMDFEGLGDFFGTFIVSRRVSLWRAGPPPLLTSTARLSSTPLHHMPPLQRLVVKVLGAAHVLLEEGPGVGK
jgi:hypothetical protein